MAAVKKKLIQTNKAADYIDDRLSIPDPKIGFFLADLPASLSIVWVAVRISDVSIRFFFPTCQKTTTALEISPSIDTRELVLGAWGRT
jgi:hypothetical protein